MLGGGNVAKGDPRDVAGDFIGNLFGDKVGSILGAVTSFAGIKSSSTSSLLGMVGPLVMGVLGKLISGGLDLASFKNLLLGEREEIMAAVPMSVQGLLSAPEAAPAVAAHKVEAAPVDREGGGAGWLWPVLILLGVGAALWYFLAGNSDTADAQPTPRSPVVESAVESSSEPEAGIGPNEVASFVR